MTVTGRVDDAEYAGWPARTRVAAVTCLLDDPELLVQQGLRARALAEASSFEAAAQSILSVVLPGQRAERERSAAS
ncbi:MAG TPA: hypothetical protein VGC67_14140 [Cellulomonas sp.]